MDALTLAQEIIDGRRITREDDLNFFLTCDLKELCEGADRIRKACVGDKVDLCSIINGRSNTGRGLRSLRDLTQHLTTRADDDHAPPVNPPRRETPSLASSGTCQAQVRFFALHRINPHAPPLVRAPVNFFEF